MSKKFFINNLNTYVGQALFSKIRNDKDEEGEPVEDCNQIFGMYIDKDSSEKPEGIKKMLKRSKPRLAMKYISECDVIIYDLHEGNLKDVDFALNALTKYPGEEEAEQKVLIIISTLQAWNKTPPKLEEIKEAVPDGEGKEGEGEGGEDKAEGEGGDNPDVPASADNSDKGSQDGEGEGGKADGEGEDGEGEGGASKKVKVVKEPEPEKPKEYRNLPFSETEFAARVPNEEYEAIKALEDKVIEFSNAKVKTYVIGSGVLYGNGETVFNKHFKSAWLQDPKELAFYGEGQNKLPTIHVKDLSTLVEKIYTSKPESQYSFGIDNTENRAQESIIQSISSGIGTKQVAANKLSGSSKEEEFTLDLNLTPSPLMVKDATNEEAEDVEFNWHCEKGLAANIGKVKQEFCDKHHLKPIKILVLGPPLTGKSYHSKKICEQYNIPHIHLKQVIDDAENIEDEEDELKVAMKDYRMTHPKERYS